MPDTVPLSDLSIAAFCPRKLYYARRNDRSPPSEQDTARELAGAYPEILSIGPDAVADRDIGLSPDDLVANLSAERDRLDRWSGLVEPAEREVFVAGKDVHGQVAKVLDDPPIPTLISPGQPPPEGVWQPQSIRAVGAAKALAWRDETQIDRAYVEYPRYGTIRRVGLTTRRKAAYRRTVRAVAAMDGPPPRLGNDDKCETCRFAEECGVRTRSLRSLR